MKKILLKVAMALSLGAFHADSFAQGWAKKFAQEQAFFMPMLAHQQPDQSYAVIGNNLVTQQALFVLITADGHALAPIAHDSIASPGFSVATGDGGFALVGQGVLDAGDASGSFNLRLLRLDNMGQKIWMKRIANYPTSIGSGNLGIDTANDGGFVITYRHDTTTVTVVKTDNEGDIVWQNDYSQPIGNYVTGIVSTNDGGSVVTLQSGTPHIFKVDGAGNVLWQYNGTGGNTMLAKDGNLLLTGSVNGHSFIKKIDQNGNDLWTQQYPILPDSAQLNYIVEKENNQFAFTTASYASYDSASHLWHRKYWLGEADSSGNILFVTQLPTSNFGFQASVLGGGTARTFIETADNGYFLTGHSNISGGYGGFGWGIKTDSTGRVYPSTLSGYVFNDANNNCLPDSSEQALVTIITVSNATDTFIVTANASGYFSLGVNEGTYNIVLESISPYWAESNCNSSSVTLSQNTDTIVLFGYNALLSNAYIVMNSATTENVIPLFAQRLTYSLQYKNIGTDIFSGHIDVQIDTNLVIDSADIAWTVQNENIYTFPVPPLNVMGNAILNIYYHANQDLDLIDRTLCFNAHAYSDTVYNTSSQWDGSNLAISASYNVVTDSVEFLLKNKGTGGMSTAKLLTVIEDNVILLSTPVQLLPSQIFTLNVPANGSTWRATIEQTPHNPYSRFVTAAFEGAGANSSGTISTGYINQYPINGFYGYDYSLCSEVVASYDPNHKYVVPEGAGNEHLIDSTTDLEYTITFQNTGNYQAYTVRIVDTLASYLNPASIKAGVSSHNYEMNFLSKNVVEFAFNNINLPDSATDEAGSQGYVKFKIKQRANNEVGTIINNDVAIYFDYNEPVITNTATVKIGEVIISGIQNLYNENVEISAYPNPFTEQTTIKLAGENFNRLELNVFDMQGRNVRKMAVAHGNQFTLNRGGFANGMYVFEIRSDDQTVIGTGRIVVK